VIENNEFGRMLKKAVMEYFKVLFQHFLEKLRKSTEASVRTEGQKRGKHHYLLLPSLY